MHIHRDGNGHLNQSKRLCNGELAHSKVHPGKRGRSVLITNMHPFKTVEIYVKTCSNCSAMHQVFPYEFGK